jgi:hypothetical protein
LSASAARRSRSGGVAPCAPGQRDPGDGIDHDGVARAPDADHLRQLVAVRDQASDAGRRLHDALHTYALIRHERHGHELAPLLHRGQHMDRAIQHLRGFVAALLADAVAHGHVRDDTPSTELADYCLNGLAAAASLRSEAAVGRLVTVTSPDWAHR